VLPSLVDDLRAAEVSDAMVAAPPRSRLAGSDRSLLAIPRAATLRVLPGQGVVPAEWLNAAFEWLRHQVPDLEGLTVMHLLVDAPTDPAGARRFLDHSRERSHILAGGPDRVQAAIGGFFGISPALSLSVAGAPWRGDALLRAAVDLRQLARRLAPQVLLAILSLEEWLGATMGIRPPANIWQQGDGPQPSAMYMLCDQLLFDASPYQVLWPGNLRRLGGPPEGAVPLPGGRVEYAAGELREWDPRGSTRPAVRARAPRCAGAVLASRRQAFALRQARRGRAQGLGDGGAAP